MLSNPIVVRMAIVLFAMALSFWIATLLLRRMRRILTEESFAVDSAPELEQFPMHTYNAVIQQLKQQKHELLSVQQVERRRAKTSENISAAVLSNLSSGVLFLTTNGLVRTANAAAKSILGFASPVGMSVSEIFRDARIEFVLVARLAGNAGSRGASQFARAQFADTRPFAKRGGGLHHASG